MTWPSLVAHIGLTASPTVLKMDIEGFEWSVLSTLASPSTPFLPDTLSMELHWKTQFPELSWYGRNRDGNELAAFIDYLFSRGGYVLVDRNDNRKCPHCSEIVLARLACRGCCAWGADSAVGAMLPG